jgi:hypothetical protein
MSTATRIDFQKSCQLPTPWKALNEPSLDFAREWAGFEARLQLAGQPLVEGLAPPPALLYGATFGAVYVAVALGSGPTLRR